MNKYKYVLALGFDDEIAYDLFIQDEQLDLTSDEVWKEVITSYFKTHPVIEQQFLKSNNVNFRVNISELDDLKDPILKAKLLEQHDLWMFNRLGVSKN